MPTLREIRAEIEKDSPAQLQERIETNNKDILVLQKLAGYEVVGALISGDLSEQKAEMYAERLLTLADSYQEPLPGQPHRLEFRAAQYRIASYFLSGEKKDKAVDGFINTVRALPSPMLQIEQLTAAISDTDKQYGSGLHPSSELRERARASLSEVLSMPAEEELLSTFAEGCVALISSCPPDDPRQQAAMKRLLGNPTKGQVFDGDLMQAALNLVPGSEEESAMTALWVQRVKDGSANNPKARYRLYHRTLRTIHALYNDGVEDHALGGKLPQPGEIGHTLMRGAATAMLENLEEHHPCEEGVISDTFDWLSARELKEVGNKCLNVGQAEGLRPATAVQALNWGPEQK